MLQIENEFYGTIRPKRVIRPGERPLHALRERGVEYVEVRLMDLDPFCPIGITNGTLHFLDMYLLNCLLRDSPPDTPDELSAIVRNKQQVASRGREPGLRLAKGAEQVPLVEWGSQVVAECAPIAAALDAANGTHAHRDALARAVAALEDPGTTPSARVLDATAREHGNAYVRFVLAQSIAHRETILALPFSAAVAERFAQQAAESIAKQRAIESADSVSFEDYLRKYLSPASLSV
jgi:glutamate--cysteine ligase